MIFKVWYFFSNLGVRTDHDDWLNRKIVLSNQFGFIFLLCCLCNIFPCIYLKQTDALIAFLITIVFYCFCLYFQYKGKHQICLVGFIYTIFFLFYFDSNSNFETCNFLYHFPHLLAVAMTFDYRREIKIIIFLYSLTISLFLVNVFTDFTLFFDVALDQEGVSFIFWRNFISAVLVQCFFVYLIFQSSINESKILNLRLVEKENAQILIQNTMNEKDVLIAELHHRVKNNLAVISSLFNLKIKDEMNVDAKNVLIESKNRLRSMALIHNRLYKNNYISQVDFGDYANELINEIKDSYSQKTIIKIKTHLEKSMLNINEAVPCGLILNELITNCFKHAWPEVKMGKIDVICSTLGQNFTLVVKDDGIGLNHSILTDQNLGMSLIQGLCEQLNAKFEFKTNTGTFFEMTFQNVLSSN